MPHRNISTVVVKNQFVSISWNLILYFLSYLDASLPRCHHTTPNVVDRHILDNPHHTSALLSPQGTSRLSLEVRIHS